MTARAFIVGLSGPAITADERAFLRDAAPWGAIVFRRNVTTPDALRRLTAAFREAVGWEAPVLVDQEGGRVQRLGPPHWPSYPAADIFSRLYDSDPQKGLAAATLGARLIAADLHAVGIDVDCLPVADLRITEADPVIGDRSYGETPDKVSALSRAAAEGLLAGGVLPVVKHLPGHGRAGLDSHKGLPVVDAARAILEATDFAAFRPLADLPLGMTAHVVFSAIDAVAPATTSAIIVEQVIRRFIGFSGLLMSDDVSMGALSGSLAARSRAALAAGCDIVLHCSGNLKEMVEIAGVVPILSGEARRRADRAVAQRRTPDAIDMAAARARFSALLGPLFAGSLAS